MNLIARSMESRSTQNHLNSIGDENRMNQSLLKENYCVILIEISRPFDRKTIPFSHVACEEIEREAKSNIDQKKIE